MSYCKSGNFRLKNTNVHVHVHVCTGHQGISFGVTSSTHVYSKLEVLVVEIHVHVSSESIRGTNFESKI